MKKDFILTASTARGNMIEERWKSAWGWVFGSAIVGLAFIAWLFGFALFLGEWYFAASLMLTSTYFLFVYAIARIYAQRDEMSELCVASHSNTEFYKYLYLKEKEKNEE
jgi:hypothetical protein